MVLMVTVPVFMAVNLLLAPFAYLKTVVHKFKLHRHYKGHDNSHWTTSGSRYLVTKKEGKCDAGG